MRRIDVLDKLPGWASIRASMQKDGGGFRAHIPANWKQGRTAYGGATAALMLAAASEKLGELPPLRSALINFVGPVTDDPFLTANLERRGRNVTNISAATYVGETVVARADFLFGAARTSKINVKFPAPAAMPPEAAERLIPEYVAGMVPQFFHNFDTRLVAGERFMMGTEGYMRTWSRHNDPASRTGLESLLCIGDVLPPAAVPLMREMAPISSMSWMFNLLTDTPETEDGWWQVESRLTAASGGYSSQVMRIWNTDGELVVEGMQSIAIFDG